MLRQCYHALTVARVLGMPIFQEGPALRRRGLVVVTGTRRVTEIYASVSCTIDPDCPCAARAAS
jgi:hypothetical protein